MPFSKKLRATCITPDEDWIDGYLGRLFCLACCVEEAVFRDARGGVDDEDVVSYADVAICPSSAVFSKDF